MLIINVDVNGGVVGENFRSVGCIYGGGGVASRAGRELIEMAHKHAFVLLNALRFGEGSGWTFRRPSDTISRIDFVLCRAAQLQFVVVGGWVRAICFFKVLEHNVVDHGSVIATLQREVYRTRFGESQMEPQLRLFPGRVGRFRFAKLVR